MTILHFYHDVERAPASRAHSWMAIALALLLLSGVSAEAQQGTPGVEPDMKRNAVSGFRSGSPLLIRIFKEESQLELWMQTGDRFELFATYPVCFWSGTLGPKFYEGDQQAPEGFYSIGLSQLVVVGKHARSLDIGFPNAFDRSLGRTGSHILLHGGCRSIGCFAMTDPVMDCIFALAEAALRNGQSNITVQIFPFRMTEANLLRHAATPWVAFWNNLKQVYDAFEATHVPPTLHTCRGAYRIVHDEDALRSAGEDCSVPATLIAEAQKAQSTARGANLSRHAGARVTIAVGPANRSIRTVSAPIALPRDNVAECNRLWSRSTGVSQGYWKSICKELDFQHGRATRTAHRAS
jgi:murein L,D-transpeptidase YafK